MNHTPLKRNQTPIPRKRERPRRKANPYGDSQLKREIVAVKVMPDGKERCNLLCKAGADEYARRKIAMWDRQGRRCALQITDICKQRQGRWPVAEVTFDHEDGRGAGKQDDRIEVNGVPQNAAVCGWCNCAKGSRKIPYNDAP
jgi:hypothetical protein